MMLETRKASADVNELLRPLFEDDIIGSKEVNIFLHIYYTRK